MNKVHILIIDPQNDFCHPDGALSVPGGMDDMDRLALMTKRIRNKIDDIHVTLDSHHSFDIAHPTFWKDSSGKNPNPFTIIKATDLENGTWNTTVPSLHKRALNYLKELEKNARYDLCVWPEHALIGTDGHNIVPNLFQELQEWERRPAILDTVTKGSNPWTEHYSAVRAEVPDPEDPSTQLNTQLVKTLMEADIVAIAGQASSHCVANTVRDVANAFNDDSYVQKLHYLKDASSAVPGCEQMEVDFLKEMEARGMKITSTTDFLS